MATRKPGKGKPSPMRITGIFLPDPRDVMKLEERALSTATRALRIGKILEPSARDARGFEALIKRLKRADSLRKAIPVVRALGTMIGERDLAFPVEKAVAGDIAAQKQLDGMGPWNAFKRGWEKHNAQRGSTGRSVFELIFEHGVEVESASIAAVRSLANHHMREAGERLASEAVLSGYLSPSALELFEHATDEAGVLPARCAGVLEFLLSQVARVEDHLKGRDPDVAFDGQRTFLDGTHGDLNLSGALLVSLLGEGDHHSISAFLKNARCPLDERTLWRWKSGSHFPKETHYVALRDSVAEQLARDQRGAFVGRADMHFWATRRLEQARRLAQVFFLPGSPAQLLQGTSASDWVRQRYPFWLERWRYGRALAVDR